MNKILCTTEKEVIEWICRLKQFNSYKDKLCDTIKRKFIFMKCEELQKTYGRLTAIQSIRRLETSLKIINQKDLKSVNEYNEIYIQYYNTKSMFEKQRILYGEKRLKELKKKCSEVGIKNTLKYGPVNSKERYINKGYTEEEAKAIVSKIARKGGDKISKTVKEQQSKGIFRKNTLKYYISSGYTLEEAKQILKEKYQSNWFILTKDNFIKKYGKELGIIKYNKMIQARVSTKKNKYGSAFCTAKVSNESLIVLNDILEYLKANKINYFGLDKKEYFIRYKNDIYLYDLVLPELKVIVEYNGSYWHPNNPYENCKFFDEEHKDIHAKKDEIKKDVAEKHGFKYFVIWDNEPNLCLKIQEIITYVNRTRNIQC